MSSTAENMVGQRLDELDVSRTHRNIFALIAAGLFLDSFDIYLAGGVLAALVDEGFTSDGNIQYFLSATFVGLFVGAVLAGVLGDRLGRRSMYQANLLVFGLASLAAVFAPNYTILVVLRLIMGIGLGAELVLGYATFSEFAPRHVRGRLQAGLGLVSNGTAFVTAIAALIIIPTLGWRAMFAVVGVGALIVWFLRRHMPESPRWLVINGREEEAWQVVESLDANDRPAGVAYMPASPKVPAQPLEPAPNRGRYAELFARGMVSRSLLAMLLYSMAIVGIYGFTAWLPTILVADGVDLAQSLGLTVLVSAGSVAGALFTAWVGDRVSSKRFLVGATLLTAVGAFVFAYAPRTDVVVIIVGFVFMTLLYAYVVMAAAVYIPALFPSRIRMRGVSLAQATARVVGVALPFAIAGIVAAAGFSAVVAAMAVLFVATGVLVLRFGIDVTGRSLEDLAGYRGDGHRSERFRREPQAPGTPRDQLDREEVSR